MNKKSDIGKAFSEAFKEFSIEPAPEVWENVSSVIPRNSKGFIKSGGLYTVAGLLLIVAAVTVYMYLYNPNDKVLTAEPQPVTKEQPIKTNNPEKIRPVNESERNDKIAVNKDEKPVVKTIRVDEPKSDITKNITEEDKNENKVGEIDNTVAISNEKSENKNISEVKNADVQMQNNKESESIVNIDPENTDPVRMIDTSIKYSEDPVICFGEDAVLKVYGGESYRWNNGGVLSETTVQPVTNSTYSVTVVDRYGSTHFHKFKVSVDNECSTVFIPSAFSPNGDGNNDLFKVYGRNIKEFTITVMNRQGQIVYTSKDINNGWDGTYKGEYMEPQVFVYTVIYRNSKGKQSVKKGQVTLIR